MNKKKLNTTTILNELRGASPFFPQEQAKEPPIEEQIASHVNDTVIPQHHDTTIPRNHETVIPPSEDELLEEVRKAAKHIGKEAATQRLTVEEKQALADIEYGYKRQGIKTSGNEIMRIATNYIIRDFRKNGEQSILAKVIKRLNS